MKKLCLALLAVAAGLAGAGGVQLARLDPDALGEAVRGAGRAGERSRAA